MSRQETKPAQNANVITNSNINTDERTVEPYNTYADINEHSTIFPNESDINATIKPYGTGESLYEHTARLQNTIPNEQTAKTAKTPNKANKLLAAVVCLTALLVVSSVVFGVVFVTELTEYSDARREYENLRELAQALERETNVGGEETQEALYNEVPDTQSRLAYTDVPDMQKDFAMLNINPDYVCWLKIDDTLIDYPVVCGTDNEKYLKTSFTGAKSPFGALFIDYRNTPDFFDKHIIIYGHNAKRGDMFHGLLSYLNGSYMDKHPVITIERNGLVYEYKVFAARKTDIKDPAYKLNFETDAEFAEFLSQCGANADAVQILTLSTCTTEDIGDERLIVQAALY